MTITSHRSSFSPANASAGERPTPGDPERRLRVVLAVNAATSVTTGLVLAVASGTIGDLLETGHPGWVRLVGIGLVLFGTEVAIASRLGADRLRRIAPWIVAADAAWVGASVVTLLLGWFSGIGVAAVVAVAAVVDSFATLQFTSWRRLPGPA